MIHTSQKTVYHFSTSSEAMSRVIDVISKDQKCREMVILFSKIQSRKRRNILLRMARYLIGNTISTDKASHLL